MKSRCSFISLSVTIDESHESPDDYGCRMLHAVTIGQREREVIWNKREYKYHQEKRTHMVAEENAQRMSALWARGVNNWA